MEREYERTRKRIDNLIRSVAGTLLRQQPDAKAVELVLFERTIPLPADVVDGVKLDDPRYLSPPLAIGRFTRDIIENSSSSSTASESLEEIQ